MRIAFVGEALIDFAGSGALAFQGYCGGSPLNAAVASARLGQPTGYLTQLSTDLFGDQLLNHMLANGIDTRFVVRAAGPSTVAFVERGPHTNRYAFYSHGSADSAWAPDPLPELPASCRFLHFGSISLLQDPAARRITDFVAANAGRRVVVFDPNVRLSLIDDLPLYRQRTRHWLSLADVLKLSAEDAEALAPGMAFDAAARDWLRAGPRAVIVTLGDDGAVLYRRDRDPILISAPEIEVADTIGAGDTFTAGISVALLARGVTDAAGLDALPDGEWRRVLQFATTAAVLNCMREGANPPTLAEVQAILPES
jgi:fructokinase